MSFVIYSWETLHLLSMRYQELTCKALKCLTSKMPLAANSHMPTIVTMVWISVSVYTNLKLKTDSTALLAKTMPHPTDTLKMPYMMGFRCACTPMVRCNSLVCPLSYKTFDLVTVPLKTTSVDFNPTTWPS